MKKFFLSVSFIAALSQTMLCAQEVSKIELDFDYQESQCNIRCTSEVGVLGSFSVYISLSNTNNINKSDNFFAVTSPGKVVATIAKSDTKSPYSIGGVGYSYIRGRYNAKPNTEIVYRMPLSDRKSVGVNRMTDVKNFATSEKMVLNAYSFKASKGDTVYASRRGLVVEKFDGMEESQSDGIVTYKQESNYVLVEHRDGTLCRYFTLDRGSVMVDVGDEVFPDTPIGLVGSYEGQNYHVRFHLTGIKIRNSNDENNKFESYSIAPTFATAGGYVQIDEDRNYTPFITQEIIQAEMTKREIGKRKK